ncbi:hypothetical protein AB0M95_40310, partial [Sphaerisporangium sp. NPDC051017]|uniref:hypothetical protein n=1 Tax=Sphaerisporangium sp. NPDC051017 TaxID=3154636 RepID=UPI00342C7D85
THALNRVNYVIGMLNYVIATASPLRNSVIVDNLHQTNISISSAGQALPSASAFHHSRATAVRQARGRIPERRPPR